MIRKIISVTSIIMLLLAFVGCGQQPQYDKKMSAYVLVKEIDDVEFDRATLEDFMSQYYENTDISFNSESADEDTYGMVYGFSVKNTNSNHNIIHDDDSGLCLEYESVEKAKEHYSDFWFETAASADYMQCFCVRVGKYIFFLGADLWKPFFDEIGIPLEKKEFSVADQYGVTYEKTKNRDLQEVISALEENRYSVKPYSETYAVVSENGDETYTIICSESSCKEFKRNRKNLNDYWFGDDVPGALSCYGLTVYATDSYMVISRGNSWDKLMRRLGFN